MRRLPDEEDSAASEDMSRHERPCRTVTIVTVIFIKVVRVQQTTRKTRARMRPMRPHWLRVALRHWAISTE